MSSQLHATAPEYCRSFLRGH